MKTQTDYYSKVLGMSLTHNPESNQSVVTKGVEMGNSIEVQEHELTDERQGFNFLMLASEDDLQSQKEMIGKILKALGADFNHVVDNLMQKSSENIFVFGELDAPEESHFFPGLQEISQDQELKKELWDELKVFKK